MFGGLLWLAAARAQTAPVFTRQPPASLLLFTDPAFNQSPGIGVSVTGSTPMTCQWFKNGAPFGGPVPISVTSPANLQLPLPPTVDQAGTYYAVVTNSSGTITSQSCVVTVVQPLSITTQPDSQDAAPLGGVVTFTVAASGTGPITYQWLLNGLPIAGATGTTLQVGPVTQALIGNNYACEVSNPYQQISTATVYLGAVLPPLIIDQLPAVQNFVMNSANMQISFSAAANSGLRVTWSKNGVPGFASTDIDTALQIDTSSTAAAGDYRATVSSQAGSVTTQTCHVSIVSPLNVGIQPAGVTTYGQGQSQSFQATATGGSGTYAYQWYFFRTLGRGDTTNTYAMPITGATASTLNLTNLQTNQMGGYWVQVTDRVPLASGTVQQVTSSHSVLSPSGAGFVSGPPVFLSQPVSYSGPDIGDVELDSFAAGAASYQWYFNNRPITSGGTSPTYLAELIGNDQVNGDYYVVASNAAGSVTSQVATVNMVNSNQTSSFSAPAPVAANPEVVMGAPIYLTATATGAAPATYQWQRNGTDIPGATARSYAVFSAALANAGNYTYRFADPNNPALGSVTSPATAVQVDPPAAALTNLSVRAATGSGAQALVAGFVVRGSGVKSALVRGIGPALGQFGVTGALADPLLTLDDSNASVLASNAGWGGSAALSQAFATAGAFSLPVSSADSAVLKALTPGAYTASITSVSGSSGIALAEVYDVGSTGGVTDFANLSTRAAAGSGAQALIAGFTVQGSGPVMLIVRGIGPALSNFGVNGALANPQIELHTTANGKDEILASNKGWGGSAEMASAFNVVSAFSLGAASPDTAIVQAVYPGQYSVVMTPGNGSTGVGLIELYVFE